MKTVAVALAAVTVVGLGLVCAPPALLALALSRATSAEQAPASQLALQEIPPSLLPRYEAAPTCSGLPWQIVAAIGYVESRHASTGGAHLDPVTGQVTPPIIGVALDGHGVAAVRVPPGGSPWHPDRTWDHAVGPMQFITSTWAAWAVDANGDGTASPHNAFDAIATAGRYLCGGQQRLTGPDALTKAIGRYNDSDSYIADVMEKAFLYGMSDTGDPAADHPGSANGRADGGPVIAGTVGPVVAYAAAQIGDPYVWGAEGPNSFDCSGLTMAAYHQIGIQLPHRADLQVTYGKAVDWRTDSILPGDLLFMRGGVPSHDYGHVGIADSTTTWINAPRTGADVSRGPIPYSRLQAVRRLVISQ